MAQVHAPPESGVAKVPAPGAEAGQPEHQAEAPPVAKAYSLARPSQCESPVIVRCEPPSQAERSPLKQRAQRIEERRRAPLDTVELGPIVIEADSVRPSFADVLSRPFAVSPNSGTYTFATGEGTQCTCMHRCPPFPFPCCDCSSPMNRYSAMPGSSPLR